VDGAVLVGVGEELPTAQVDELAGEEVVLVHGDLQGSWWASGDHGAL
jgi:hypothetical protein